MGATEWAGSCVRSYSTPILFLKEFLPALKTTCWLFYSIKSNVIEHPHGSCKQFFTLLFMKTWKKWGILWSCFPYSTIQNSIFEIQPFWGSQKSNWKFRDWINHKFPLFRYGTNRNFPCSMMEPIRTFFAPQWNQSELPILCDGTTVRNFPCSAIEPSRTYPAPRLNQSEH